MTIRTIYVIRHGQTEWNAAKRMQGRLDSALTALGRVQADLHGSTLARLGGIEALIVSPLGRTRETADLINTHLSLPIRHEAALMERDCGTWSGLTIQEIEAAYAEEWNARNDDPYHHRPPEGENLADMESRVGGVLDGLLHCAERTLALITHGVMSRVILKRLLDLSPAQAVTVRHPNELFYRVEIEAPGRAESAYFLQGQGPKPGLLQLNQVESIPEPTGG